MLEGILLELHPVFRQDAFVGESDLTHLLVAEFGLHHHIGFLLVGVDLVVEHVAVDTLGHAPALKQTAIGVPDCPSHPIVTSHRFSDFVVQTHVEQSVHGPRHGDGRSRTHGKQQRIGRIAKLPMRLFLQLSDELANHAMNLGTKLRDGVDGVVATESLGSDDEARRNWHLIKIQILKMISLISDKHLVIHLGCRFPKRTYEHLGVVGHDVANEFLVQVGGHAAQRFEDAGDEVVQGLHQEGVGKQIAVELLRLAADQSGGLALVELAFGVEELRYNDLQRVLV